MRLKYIPAFCLLLMSPFLAAQKVAISNDSLNKLLCRNWIVHYQFADGVKTVRDTMPKGREYSMIFNRDSTFQMINGSLAVPGRWCFDQTRKHVELTLHGKNILRIYSIGKNEMIITSEDDRKRYSSEMPKSFICYVPVRN